MKKLVLGLVFVLALGCLTVFAQKADQAAPDKDIIETVDEAGNFKTLIAAIKAADLIYTLQGPGPFTLFAPTDEAFAKLPAGTLENLLKPENKSVLSNILLNHVILNKVTAAKVKKLKSAGTMQGTVKVKVKKGKVMINDSNVIKADIMTNNGVIHVIDTVLMPNK